MKSKSVSFKIAVLFLTFTAVFTLFRSSMSGIFSLFYAKDEILLQKRSDFKSWGLPGGAMEFGESAQETCVREFLEETGLKVKVKSLLGISTDFIQHYPNGDVAQAVVIEFLVELVGKTNKKPDSETLELKYFSKDNLPNIFNKQHLKFIEHYYQGDYPFID